MFKFKSTALSVLFVLAILCIAFGEAAPQKNSGGNGGASRGGGKGGASQGGGNGGGTKQTAQQKAAQKPGGVSPAKGNTTMLDKTVQIK